jgi:hypothetical protein
MARQQQQQQLGLLEGAWCTHVQMQMQHSMLQKGRVSLIDPAGVSSNMLTACVLLCWCPCSCCLSATASQTLTWLCSIPGASTEHLRSIKDVDSCR